MTSPPNSSQFNFVNTEEGTSGNETIEGTDSNDLIFLLGGDDRADGEKGDDYIIGGSGDDELDGGSDDDVILGGTNDDDISGGSGNDMIYGEVGNDTLQGREGDDTLVGGSGQDTFAIWTIGGVQGHDIVVDFESGASGDTIEFGEESQFLDVFHFDAGTVVGAGYVGGNAADIRNYSATVFLQDVNESEWNSAQKSFAPFNSLTSAPVNFGNSKETRYASDGADTFEFLSVQEGDFEILNFNPSQDVVTLKVLVENGGSTMTDAEFDIFVENTVLDVTNGASGVTLRIYDFDEVQANGALKFAGLESVATYFFNGVSEASLSYTIDAIEAL